MNENDPYLRIIRGSYSYLNSWAERARRNPPEEPQPGSELAIDDATFRWHRISETVRLSLIAAGEHLRLARDAIEVDEPYPSAHFTLLRGAFVGAAQAVWILGPDDPDTRQQRGFTVIAEMYEQMTKNHRELETFNLNERQRDLLSQQKKWLDARIASLGAQRKNKRKLVQTEFIRWALEYRFKDEDRREDGRMLWRQMSADAHVLSWSLMQRAQFASPTLGSDLGIGTASGSLKDISQPFNASFLMLKEGWSLFDRRCEER